MEYYRHEVRAGLLVAGGILILLAMLFFSADLSSLFLKTRQIHVTFKNVSGLGNFDPVLFKGVKIGKVSNMKVDGGGNIRITLKIDAELPITKTMTNGPQGTKFQIISTGILGESAVEMVPGDPRAPDLQPGETTLVGTEVIRIQDLTYLVVDIASNVRDAMTTLSTTVNDPEIQARLQNILQSLESTSGNLDHMVGGNMGNVNVTMANLNQTSRELRAASSSLKDLTAQLSVLITDNREQLDVLVRNYKDLPVQFEGQVERVQDSITSLIDENRKQIGEITRNLEKTSKNLEELTAEVKRRPYRLIRKD